MLQFLTRLKSVPEVTPVDPQLLRFSVALENSASCFMIADPERRIVYANKAVRTMLAAAEKDIQKELPQFSATNLIGRSIDEFHKNPQHQIQMLNRLTGQHTATIIVGGRSFKLIVTPLRSEAGVALGASVEWLDTTEILKVQRRTDQVISALDGTSTNVMIADEHRTIIYMNKSVERMLRSVEPELRKALPHFSVDKIIGSNMDIFHKNPAHQAHLLERLQNRYEGNIKVADLHFRLIANPILSPSGERLGSVVEWQDRTKEVHAEEEINRLVQAAVNGDFSARVSTENKQGFLLALAQGLNTLMDTAGASLQDINSVLQTVAAGDLTRRIENEYNGTFEELKNGCNNTATNLSNMLGEIRLAVETINTAANEISQGNTDLSSRTEEQASSLEETASSMEQLTSTVRQNADNARQANSLAAKASEVAVSGGALIEQVVQTMSSINESARKIADIIGVIDGIAFQTNILALNAAVEAARAGEQGRGFAVVASEVRSLAQRSANAAKDIKSLISDSVHKISNGNELVAKSGDTMRDVVTSIKRVNDIMGEIAAASAEQASGLDEIGKAVGQMDETTQQNAALVEEAAAAAESLLSQSEQLQDLVARFRLDGHGELANRRQVQVAAKRPALSKGGSKSSPPSKSSTTKPALNVRAKPADDDEWESF